VVIGVVCFGLGACRSTGDDDDRSQSPRATREQPRLSVGREVTGLVFGGHLAGRKAFVLDDTINRGHCWADSVTWTGDELFFALSGIDFTSLQSGAGYRREPDCVLPQGQRGFAFDIYRATLERGGWSVTGFPYNSPESDAGISVSGDMMAYVIYHADNDWNIYLSRRDERDGWSAPATFSQNSECREDNPQIYADARKMIFESGRERADGASCHRDAEHRALWLSRAVDGVWQRPEPLTGPPAVNTKNTQPWVDEASGFLYWTADRECACIRRVRWVGDAAVGAAEDIVTPAVRELAAGTADGKAVFVGEYSEAEGYAFFSCALAADRDPTGSTRGYARGRYEIDIQLCVVSLD
jgi:hypothetical protein